MPLPRSLARWFRLVRFAAVLVACVAAAGGAEGALRTYRLPAGDAATTLREFSEASGCEILFAAEAVRGVTTNAVAGELTALAALERMLDGTNLYAMQERHSGALAVRRQPAGAGRPEAASAPDSPSKHMMKPHTFLGWLGGLPAAISGFALAQTTPAPGDADPGPDAVLSPFEVKTTRDDGYAATNTLAGSRLNTELRNTPASLSVFTRQFLDDIGAQNLSEALRYSLNGQRDYTDFTGLNSVQFNDVQVQMRGFTGASLTRNFFPVTIATDTYNTERLDFSRGPNSILFGIGGPGGVIDTSTKRARLNHAITQAAFRVGSWDDYRATIDLNRPVTDKAAVRVNGVWQDRQSWREFEFMRRKAAAATATFRPFRSTELRVEGEYNDTHQLTAQPWPAADYVTPWLGAGRPISANNTTAVAGTAVWGSSALVYDPASPQGPVSYAGTRQTPITPPLAPSLANFPRPIRDESILPRSSNLTGPGSTANYFAYSYSVFLEQRLGDLVVELAYNRQYDNRDAYSAVGWNDVALRGDANALLPGAILPNGQTPAGAGQPNPNAGKFYVISNPSVRFLERRNDNYRATLAYELDLTKQRAWLGRHRFAALAMRSKVPFRTDALNEVNITPAGTAAYPNDITAPGNTLFRRTNLDFSSGDSSRRGQHNPFTHPIVGVNGVTSGFRRISDTSNFQDTTTDTTMVAGQSALWASRVHLTAGVRHDEQQIRVAANPTRDPVTREFSQRSFAGVPTSEFSGNTRTYGIVYHATTWLSAFYNNANNFVPQTQLDIGNQPLGPRRGRGEDVGVRLALWGDRLGLTVNRYRTIEVNRVLETALNNSLTQVVNEVWEARGEPARFMSFTARDTVDNSGTGWEAEVTGNLTKAWRLSANFSRAELQQSNTTARYGAYLEANRALWQQSANLPLVPPVQGGITGANPTVADAIRQADVIYASFRASEGRMPRLHVRESFNAFTSYTLAAGPEWLRRTTLGAGANYRGRAVTGYDSTRGGAPVFGNEYVLFNVMAARSFTLPRRLGLRLQLNVDNVLAHDDLLITDKDNTGTYRFVYLTPRRWSLTSTLTF